MPVFPAMLQSRVADPKDLELTRIQIFLEKEPDPDLTTKDNRILIQSSKKCGSGST